MWRIFWFVCFTNNIPQCEINCPLRLIDANYEALCVACMSLTRFNRQLCFTMPFLLCVQKKKWNKKVWLMKKKISNSKLILFIGWLKTESKFSACIRDTVLSLTIFGSWFSWTKKLQRSGIFWWLCLHTSLERVSLYLIYYLTDCVWEHARQKIFVHTQNIGHV